MAAVSPAYIRVDGIADTLRRLENELGDNGKVYRATIRNIKKAGNAAVIRARGFLPVDENMPSGFTYQNDNGWAQSRVTGRRPFPRYEQRAASSSIKVISAREKSVRTATGWRGGKMFGIAIEMKDAAGSIYDVAGNAKSRRQLFRRMSDPRSMRFINLLKENWIGDPKWRYRVVLPAVVDTRPEIIEDIRDVLTAAVARIPDATLDPWSIR